jgi:hypothetical protein
VPVFNVSEPELLDVNWTQAHGTMRIDGELLLGSPQEEELRLRANLEGDTWIDMNATNLPTDNNVFVELGDVDGAIEADSPSTANFTERDDVTLDLDLGPNDIGNLEGKFRAEVGGEDGGDPSVYTGNVTVDDLSRVSFSTEGQFGDRLDIDAGGEFSEALLRAENETSRYRAELQGADGDYAGTIHEDGEKGQLEVVNGSSTDSIEIEYKDQDTSQRTPSQPQYLVGTTTETENGTDETEIGIDYVHLGLDELSAVSWDASGEKQFQANLETGPGATHLQLDHEKIRAQAHLSSLPPSIEIAADTGDPPSFWFNTTGTEERSDAMNIEPLRVVELAEDGYGYEDQDGQSVNTTATMSVTGLRTTSVVMDRQVVPPFEDRLNRPLNETQVTIETDGIDEIDAWATQSLPEETDLGEQILFGIDEAPATTIDASYMEPLRTEEARDAWGELVVDEDVETRIVDVDSTKPLGTIEAQTMEPITHEHTAIAEIDLAGDERVSLRNQPEPGDSEDPVEQLTAGAEIGGLSALGVGVDDPPTACTTCEGFDAHVERQLDSPQPSLSLHGNLTRDDTSIEGTVDIQEPAEEIDFELAMGESETDADGNQVESELESLLVDYEGDQAMKDVDIDLTIDNSTDSSETDDPLAIEGSIGQFPESASFSARFDHETEQADLEEPACGFEATESVPARVTAEVGGDAASFSDLDLRMGPESADVITEGSDADNFLGIDTEEHDFHARLLLADLAHLDLDFSSGVRENAQVGEMKAAIDAGISDLLVEMNNQSREEPAIQADLSGIDNPIELHCEGARMTLGPDEGRSAPASGVIDSAQVKLTGDMPEIKDRPVERMEFDVQDLRGAATFEPGILDDHGRYLEDKSGLAFRDGNGHGHADEMQAVVDLERVDEDDADCGGDGGDGEDNHFILDGSLPVDDIEVSVNTEDSTNTPGDADAYVVYEETCTKLSLEAEWTGLNSVGFDTDGTRTIANVEQDSALFAIVDVTVTDDPEPENDDNNRFEVRDMPERFEVSTTLPHLEPYMFEWEPPLKELGCLGHMGAPTGIGWSGYTPDIDTGTNSCLSFVTSDTIDELRYHSGDLCHARVTDLEARDDSSLDTSEAGAVLFNIGVTRASVEGCPLASDTGTIVADAKEIGHLSLKAARDAAETTVDVTVDQIQDGIKFARDLEGYTEYHDIPHFGKLRGTFQDAHVSIVNESADNGMSIDYGNLASLGTISDQGLPIWWDSDPASDPNTRFDGYIDHSIPSEELSAECLNWQGYWSEDEWNERCTNWESDRQIAERVANKYFDNMVQFQNGGDEFKLPPEAFVPMLLDRDI